LSTRPSRKINDSKRILNKKEVTEKVLVTWNQKYDFREKVRRQKSIEYAEKLTASERFRLTMKKGGKRYLEVEQLDEETGEIRRLTPHISIDEEQIALDELYDGFNVLITSEITMSDEDMLASYRSLSRIEDCFKVMKPPLMPDRSMFGQNPTSTHIFSSVSSP